MYGKAFRICTVTGFTLGYHTKDIKVRETLLDIEDGLRNSKNNIKFA